MIHAESDVAVVDDHEAHITPNGPADEQSDDMRSDAKSDYAITDDREAHIAPDGPAK